MSSSMFGGKSSTTCTKHIGSENSASPSSRRREDRQSRGSACRWRDARTIHGNHAGHSHATPQRHDGLGRSSVGWNHQLQISARSGIARSRARRFQELQILDDRVCPHVDATARSVVELDFERRDDVDQRPAEAAELTARHELKSTALRRDHSSLDDARSRRGRPPLLAFDRDTLQSARRSQIDQRLSHPHSRGDERDSDE
jgi:hypothetical protein